MYAKTRPRLTLWLPLLLAAGPLPLPPDRQEGQDKPPAAAPVKPVPPPAEPQDLQKALAPYLSEGLLGRLEVAPRIVRMSEDQLANEVLPLMTGERNRLILEVRNLIEGLGDVRYDVRERCETALVNMGPQILPIVESMQQQPDLEVSIRLARVLEELRKAGSEDIVRKALIARGLAESLEYRPGPLEARALVAALDSLDPRVRIAAVQALGTLLADPVLAREFGSKVFERLTPDIDRQDLVLRNAATATLGGMPTDEAREFLLGLYKDAARPVSHRLLALRLLAVHTEAQPLADLASALPGGTEPLLVEAAAFYAGRKGGATPAVDPPVDLVLRLKDGGEIKTTIVGMRGDKVLFTPSPEFEGLDALRIPRAEIDEIRPTAASAGEPTPGIHMLLKSGTQLAVTGLTLEGDKVMGEALGRKISLPRSTLRGLLPDPRRGRALGGSRRSDQIRLVEDKGKLLEGRVVGLADSGVVLLAPDDEKRELPWAQVETVLFQLDAGSDAGRGAGDINQYIQVDLHGGERLVGFLLDLDGTAVSLASDSLGCLALPLTRVASMQLSNSGRALTGFTLVTDYGNTRVVEYDGEGRIVWKLEDLFDPLDAELTPTGTILVTEQGDNAVREYDREGNVTWEFTDLSHPLDADRLPNGNTLITDPGNFRVLEVDPDKKILWEFGRKEANNPSFKPYDADRLPNGNTLIADYGGEQVIEITPAGKIAWRYAGTKFVCDADRLPNGNTLITMRQPPQVIEVTPAHTVIWQLPDLQLPWDADRLPDGTTMVSENFGVGIYNAEGKRVRKLDAEWASEANAY